MVLWHGNTFPIIGPLCGNPLKMWGILLLHMSDKRLIIEDIDSFCLLQLVWNTEDINTEKGVKFNVSN